MLPAALAPAVVGLMTGEPGCLAVPLMVAVSLIALPSVTAPLAAVVSVGCIGVTLKHSERLVALPGSAVSATPLVVKWTLARQQYLPAEVIDAESELTVALVLLTALSARIEGPPGLQLAWLLRS